MDPWRGWNLNQWCSCFPCRWQLGNKDLSKLQLVGTFRGTWCSYLVTLHLEQCICVLDMNSTVMYRICICADIPTLDCFVSVPTVHHEHVYMNILDHLIEHIHVHIWLNMWHWMCEQLVVVCFQANRAWRHPRFEGWVARAAEGELLGGAIDFFEFPWTKRINMNQFASGKLHGNIAHSPIVWKQGSGGITWTYHHCTMSCKGCFLLYTNIWWYLMPAYKYMKSWDSNRFLLEKPKGVHWRSDS